MRVLRRLLMWALGLEFLWAFIDKLFGLGFATKPENAWISGGSPTYGFLVKGTTGPFAPIFQAIGGKGIIDWLFMLCLLGVGIALILGIGLKISAIAGGLLMFLMWSATLPKPNNLLLIDDHVINLFVLLVIGFVFTQEEVWASLANKWKQTRLVKRAPFLQ